MLLTKGVELSGYFDVLGQKWCAALLRSVGWRCLWYWRGAAFYLSDQRCRAVYSCSADITLKRLCEIPVNRLIIFEARQSTLVRY